MKLSHEYKQLLFLLSVVFLCSGMYLISLKTVEGLATPATAPDAVVSKPDPALLAFVDKMMGSDLETIKDSLYLSKYKNNYQDFLKDLMEWCDLQTLVTLTSNNSGFNISKGINSTNTEFVSSLNQYAEFRNTIQGIYDRVIAKA